MDTTQELKDVWNNAACFGESHKPLVELCGNAYNKILLLETRVKILEKALLKSLEIADTFALNHKLSAPEVIVAIQIREAIERLVKEIET